MKQNCKYFRYVHKLFFLEIKELLVLFDKISSFRLREDSVSAQTLVTIPVFAFFVGRYYQRRVYGINILSVHSCKQRTRTRMRKVRKPTSIVPSFFAFEHNSDWPIPATFLFCPSRYTCGFSCVFGCDTAFVVAHTHVL